MKRNAVWWVDRQAEKRLQAVKAQYGDDLDGVNLETFQKVYLSQLDLATVGQEMMRQENGLLTMEDYEAQLKKMADAYPNRSREELMEQETLFTFASSYYADMLAQRIDGYVAQCFIAHFAR